MTKIRILVERFGDYYITTAMDNIGPIAGSRGRKESAIVKVKSKCSLLINGPIEYIISEIGGDDGEDRQEET